MLIRPAVDADVPSVRRLVNEAYRELASQGLNFTASYQDDEITRNRMATGRTFVVVHTDHIIATISLREEDKVSNRRCAYVGQFGVLPEFQRQGVGALLMSYVENLALRENYEFIQLDTAKPATHLVRWYQNRGYQVVGEQRFQGKTYESWILEKKLG